MQDPSPQLRWQNLFDQHRIILEKHLEFLKNAQKNSSEASTGTEILQACLAQTETMTTVFNETAALFLEERESKRITPLLQNAGVEPFKTEDPATPSRKPTERKVDASGLFMTDTNPTPIDELLQGSPASAPIRTKAQSQANSKAKRRGSNPEGQTETATGSTAMQEPMRKKARIEQQVQAARDQLNSLPSPHVSSEGDSFAREVEARVRAKEQKRKKNKDKKRKRESGDSVLESLANEPTGQGNSAREHKPKKKKHKKGNISAEQSNGISKLNGEKARLETKKRTSPGAEDGQREPTQIENGAPRKKRKKASR